VYHAESAFDRSDHPPEANLHHICWLVKLKLKDGHFCTFKRSQPREESQSVFDHFSN
jgi:hypothetical protein